MGDEEKTASQSHSQSPHKPEGLTNEGTTGGGIEKTNANSCFGEDANAANRPVREHQGQMERGESVCEGKNQTGEDHVTASDQSGSQGGSVDMRPEHHTDEEQGEESEEEQKEESLKPEDARGDRAQPGNPETEYESFVQAILGCLDEIRNPKDGSDKGEADQSYRTSETVGGSEKPLPEDPSSTAGIQSDGNESCYESETKLLIPSPGDLSAGKKLVTDSDNDETSPVEQVLDIDDIHGKTSLEDGESVVDQLGKEIVCSDRVSSATPSSESFHTQYELSCETCDRDDCEFHPKPGASSNAEVAQSRRTSDGHDAVENAHLPENASISLNRPAYLILSCAYINHSEVTFLGNWSIRESEIDKFLEKVGPIIPQSERNLRETNVQLPIPRDFRKHRWLAKSVQRFELGTSGYSYEGGIKAEKMHGYGRLVLGDRKQFIGGKWCKNRLIELESCQFTLRSGAETVFIVKRLDDYLLTVCETHFVARVMLESPEELDFTASIARLKAGFFGKLTIMEILEDELNHKRRAALHDFESLLKNMLGEDADPIIRANILILLSKCSESTYSLRDLLHDQTIPANVQDAATVLLDTETRYLNDTFMKNVLRAPNTKRLDIRGILSKIYREGVDRHRQMLIGKCPSALPALLLELQTLEDSKILYITRADIDVLDHLASQPCFGHYKEFVEDLVARLSQTLNKIRTYTPPSSVIPLMSPVYGFLFKSFWEIVSEIIESTDGYQYHDMLKRESGTWKLVDNIKWPEGDCDDTETQGLKFLKASERKSSLHHRSLEIQYKIIFHMIRHFSPDNFFKNKKYGFKFCVLEQDLSLWQKGLKMLRKNVGLAKRLEKLSEERLVWLYMLDHTIHNTFKDDPNYTPLLMKPYNSLFQGHISFVEKSPTDCHESFRVLTHSIVKFVTSTASYFRDTRGKPGVDVEILVQQIWTFSSASRDIEQDLLAFSSFRDLIAEYNRYLSLRLFINIEAAPGHFSYQISEMMQTFMRIVKTSLKKKSVPTTALVGYFRSLNDFLDDFKNIDFLAMWYVKSLFYKPEFMEKVDNKLSSTDNCSYRVTVIEKYVQAFNLLRHQPPNHYIIDIVSELLKCIEKCLGKQWNLEDEEELPVVQLECTSVLLDAVRRSFMYLKEQPDYVDFEAFKKESVGPFSRLVSECATVSDLKKRTDTVKESFWYLRKMDEIGIDQALMLFKNANSNDSDFDTLLDCYNLYLSYYENLIAQYNSMLSDGKTHTEGLCAVKEMLHHTDTVHFTEWTKEFKTQEIPILLAGLSAIWSILVSKDVSSAGKFLKPHCIQILCVLRLLSVDQSNGTYNHLAQVLTGQGKSVILGLLSATLALTGHKVRVLCYSEYLSSRDQKDFEDFFQTFQITRKINYGTFEDMADSFLNPNCNGIQSSLRQLVEYKVLEHTNWSSLGSVTTESKDTVLLIDEVDVFFSDRFYGNVYRSVAIVGIDGLSIVQEKIWSLALRGNLSTDQISLLTREFIAKEIAAGNVLLLELNDFLNKPGSFSLLEYEGGDLCVRKYTNQALFDEHLLLMASDACTVANCSDTDEVRSDFVINDAGLVCCKKEDNIYSSSWFWEYFNVFNYFRLKKSNYDSKNFRNYGYLHLGTGHISYARLPSQFRLILGVSGTITNLGAYEKRAIESYEINSFSILPSYFGQSNLKFIKEADFHYFIEEQDWLKEIYNRANQIVESRGAVMIFFESDSMIYLFAKEYKTKFDRVNEITVNTDAHHRDVYIDEAGRSCTVTLATRDMGRGVDYKSSLCVEKNGGVQVIQTFFSTDIKEEIQIKGRTARKDNKGSYELMICKEHLVRNEIISNLDEYIHTYSSLDRIRQELCDEKGKTVTENINKCERNHITTMKYFGLA